MHEKYLTLSLTVSILLTACGTVPLPDVPAAPAEPAITKIEDAGATKRTGSAAKKPTATGTSDKSASPAAAVVVSKPVTSSPQVNVEAIATPDRTANEHVSMAIEQLQAGDESRAKSELISALLQDPDNITASNLLMQINTSPDKFFREKKSFNYKVEQGESLSAVAGKFLDDPLQFHILAKYNNISDPSTVHEGQVIRIPGENKSTPKPERAAKPEPVADDEIGLKLAQAQRLYDSGKYQETIDLLENISSQGKYATKRRDLLVLTYAQYANVLTEKAELLEAEAILEKAITMDPGNRKLKDQLVSIQNRRKAADLYNAGIQALTNGNQDKAFEAFRKVIKLNPKHELAKRKVAEIKSEVIESLHKSAMQSYHKQELNTAIGLWDKILELEPEHELARLYRARAISLKKRFDNL